MPLFLPKTRFLSLGVSTGPYRQFVDTIIKNALEKRSSYICVANVHMLIEAHKDPQFARIVNEADMVTPDGMPLSKGIKLLYGSRQDRVAGMDLLPDLLQEAAKKSVSVYFFGGTQTMLDAINNYCRQHYSNLSIAGSYSPPFRALTTAEKEDIVANINSSGAGLIFVVLGCPKQERWMAEMKGKVQACMIGVGGALPVLVGMQKRAPLWMQKASLEWLFRLIQEPRRLLKRYAVTNTLFILLLWKTLLMQKLGIRKEISEFSYRN